MSEQQAPPQFNPADITAVALAATEAAQNAKSAAEAAQAVRDQLANLELPQPMLDMIGQTATAAWEARMREIGALREDGTAEQVGGAVQDALAQAAAPVVDDDPLIQPTLAHRLLGRKVRQSQWGK